MQVYEPGAGLDFHFDKDEARFRETTTMQHPTLSMILYLYGDSQAALGAQISTRGPTDF